MIFCRIPIHFNELELKAFFVLFFISIIIYFRVVFKGTKYDDLKRKINSKYEGYHFIRIGWRGIKGPSFIKDDIKNDEIQRVVKVYNNYLRVFYILIIAIIIMILNTCLRQ